MNHGEGSARDTSMVAYLSVMTTCLSFKSSIIDVSLSTPSLRTIAQEWSTGTPIAEMTRVEMVQRHDYQVGLRCGNVPHEDSIMTSRSRNEARFQPLGRSRVSPALELDSASFMVCKLETVLSI